MRSDAPLFAPCMVASITASRPAFSRHEHASRACAPDSNAISAGAMRTLSLAGIKGGKSLMGTGRNWSLLKEDTSMEGVAGCALYLLSPLGRSIAGEVIHVDAGFHVVGVPDAGEEE